jgi:hypothetical protein
MKIIVGIVVVILICILLFNPDDWFDDNDGDGGIMIES